MPLEDIRPTTHEKIYDLVQRAGVNVADWADYANGEERPYLNPRYCYRWSFVEPGHVVVLCLWFIHMVEEEDGTILWQENYRFGAEHDAEGAQVHRALEVDAAIRLAWEQRLPIRVIVCYRANQNVNRVDRRILDAIPWAVRHYDPETGATCLVRGAIFDRIVDQFSLPADDGAETRRRAAAGNVFVRNQGVRQRVLDRATGLCEYCAEPGFTMPSGRIYLETHHVIPLAEGGPDTERNVVALCPNHHREAHHGANREEIRSSLREILNP